MLKYIMKKNFLFFLLLTVSFITYAQSTHAQPSNDKIPLSRLFFHENIEATQKKILSMDGKDDNLFAPTSNESLNKELTYTATKRIDELKQMIEEDSSLDNN